MIRIQLFTVARLDLSANPSAYSEGGRATYLFVGQGTEPQPITPVVATTERERQAPRIATCHDNAFGNSGIEAGWWLKCCHRLIEDPNGALFSATVAQQAEPSAHNRKECGSSPQRGTTEYPRRETARKPNAGLTRRSAPATRPRANGFGRTHSNALAGCAVGVQAPTFSLAYGVA